LDSRLTVGLRNVVRAQQAAIESLEAELLALRPYEEIAQAIRADVAAHADAEDLEATFHAAVARVRAQEKAKLLLDAFDGLPAETRLALLIDVFDDGELRAVLAQRRVDALADAYEQLAVADVVREARRDHRLDTRLLHEGQTVEVGLFQPHRIEHALQMGRRSDFCSRELTLRATGAGCELRVLADRLLLRGAYDGPAEYPRREWERDRIADHRIIEVGVVVTEPEVELFDPTLYPGSTFDIRSGECVARSRLAVGYVEVDGHDVFTRV